MSSLRQLALTLPTAALGWAAPVAAHAQAPAYPGDIAGRGRVYLDAEFAYWLGSIRRNSESSELSIKTDAVGVVGYPRIPFGGGFAYALSERLVLGVHGAIAARPRRVDSVYTVSIHGSIGPWLQVMFLRERNVRPFAILRAGIGTGRTFERPPGQRGLEATGGPLLSPSIAVGTGAHAFVTEAISIDAVLFLEHRWNYRRGATPPGAPTDLTFGSSDPDAAGWRLRDTTLVTAITLGFSRWF